MSKPKILIVDDDKFITSLLEGILVRAGYAVSIANDGRAALDLLARDPGFDTILLDRQMPELDGLQVLNQLKQTQELKEIPVVLETAMAGEEEIREGLRAGALYYLVKPLDPKLVVQVVGAATKEFAIKRKLWAEMDGVRSAMGLIQNGVYHYRTMRQCEDLATLLAKACPDPKRSVIGLLELMINALEHGNLGISYDEKSALIEAKSWASEVDNRQQLPEYRDKWVEVSLARSSSSIRFRIKDMGKGFSWQEFQDVNPERMFDSHGRGILLAKWEAFDQVEYQGLGNCVEAEIAIP